MARLNKDFLVLFVILFYTAILFFPSLQGEFLNWDDNEHITENPLVTSLDPGNIKRIFQDTSLNAYFPLTTLSFALEYQWAGENPLLYRLDNLLLHLAVVGLIYLLGLRLGLTVEGAGLAGAIFAIHPMHVESVVWITERKDLLYSLFYLLALNQYWMYVRQNKRSAYVLSVIFGLLSMLAKPMAVSLPFILLLFDGFLRRKIDRRTLCEKIPHLLVTIPFFIITFLAHDRVYGGEGGKSILIFIWSLSFYLKKFLFPFPLNPLYPLPEPVHILQPAYLLAVIILITVILMTFIYRRSRFWLFALGFFLISIAIMLKIDAIETSLVADRYMYLPSLGFCLLAGHLWRNRRFLAQAGMTVMLIGLSFYAFTYSLIWKDSLRLWNYVIAQPQARAIAFNNRGILYLKEKRFAEALMDFNEALKRDPHHISSWVNRGLLFLKTGDHAAALHDFNRALMIDPRDAGVYNNRGLVYMSIGERDLALQDYQKALSLAESSGNTSLIRLMTQNIDFLHQQ